MRRGLALALASALVLHLARGSLAEGIIAGSREPCQNEGEAVALDKIKDMGCFKCICKNGFVECDHGHCPDVKNCYMQMPREGCCVKCKGCFYNGVMHSSDTEWTEPREPCRVLRCEAGVVTESEAHCHTPCDNPKPPLPGQCCPSCLGCHINGQKVSEGRDVTISEDPCLKCHCSKSKLTCVKKACPVLPCPITLQRTPPGECCPVCVEGKPAKLFPDHIQNKPCILGKDFHLHGKSFELDKCTKCSCINGTTFCKRQSCPVLECSPLDQTTSPRECCPHCPLIEGFQTGCTMGGKTYQENEYWRMDECKSCMCHSGKIQCAMENCPPLNCVAGYHSEQPQGQCCPRCVESESVCTVFGDPHYKTFDGKFYTFQGPCKYLLTSDCVNDTFSIRITNDARSTRYSSWAKTVSLKIGATKINLGKKMRVKVNGERVALPHGVSEGMATVERKDNFVLVNTSLGIRLLWDGNGFLEVAAPTSFKNNLCGLCGNYNSYVRDDLKMRGGEELRAGRSEDVWRFGESWRVGGKKACSREPTPPPRRKACGKSAKKMANKICKFFNKSDAFSVCRQKLNPDNYAEACAADMCKCRTKTCYCDAFAAYARECQRIGAALKDWRRETGCGVNKRNGKLYVASQRQRHVKQPSFPLTLSPLEPFSKPPPGHVRRPPPNLH